VLKICSPTDIGCRSRLVDRWMRGSKKSFQAKKKWKRETATTAGFI
jgi:hypothetical protein